MRSLFPCCLLVLTFVYWATAVTVTPHYRTAWRTVKRTDCRTQYYHCGWWWWWRRTCRYWRCYYRTVSVSYRTCQDGYKGTQCNVPTCNPPCKNNGVCIGINSCNCPSRFTGPGCQTRRCSYATDCYPGICRSGTVTCVCSSEFDGPNCQTMKEGPIFPICAGKLMEKVDGPERTLARNNCTFGDQEEVEKIYTNERDFSHVGLEWHASYRKLDDVPPYPTEGYLRTFRTGVISARANIILRDTSGAVALNRVVNCVNAGSNTNPQETIPCDIESPFNEGAKHDQELELIMSGTTGGFKEILRLDGTQTYQTRYFSGREGSLRLIFKFDLEPPVHCTEEGSCEVEGIKPIVLASDITQNPQVTLTFTGWNDTDAGLYGFKYNVYRMAPNDEGLLQNDSVPVIVKEYNLYDENVANSSFTLPAPGLYAIHGHVLDFANNVRYARAFVLYHDGTNGIEPTNEPLSVNPGPGNGSIDRAYWLNTLTGAVTVSWKGRYQNSFIAENQLMAPIAPLLQHDNYLDYQGGNISTAGTDDISGITSFQYALIHRIQTDSSRKRRALDPPDPSEFVSVEPLSDSVSMPLDGRKSGDGYTLWIKAGDALGNEMSDFLYIRIDDSAPSVDTSSLVFNRNVSGPERGFFSSIDIIASDFEGGIDRIDFSLYDIFGEAIDPILIHESSQPGQLSEQDKEICQAAGDCTCTNLGECYTKPQKVFINNCWFVQYMDVPARFNASIVNRARLMTNVTLDLGQITALSGIGEYPPVDGLRDKGLYGYTVTLTWYLPGACYPIRFIKLRLTGGSEVDVTLSKNEVETEVTDLVPYADYTASIYIVYDDGNRESPRVEYQFNTGEPPNGGGEGGLGGGTIAGIVIGVLLLIAIIVIVVLILLRVRQHQPPVPQRVITMKNNMMNRISRRFGHGADGSYPDEEEPPPYPGTATGRKGEWTGNVAYALTAPGSKLNFSDEDIYTYGELKTDPNAKWKHSNDKVTVGKTIHIGRFAEIKEGMLRDNSGNRKVALKMLKEHTPENELLMKAKLNFMATVVPNHNNIVSFVGAITEGPILLLEYCDESLKDWLKKISKVSDEEEDNMINFSTDIARGMKHLHDNGIIHRRLGARNILLKNIPMMGRLVAKVTGFGPMKGETTGDGVASDKERIPIKWMALEQLGIEPGETRTYNEKTDVWSYGITIWEIFSKGDNPWPNNKSGEIRALLERGIRPENPLYSTDDLYDDVMTRCWDRDPERRPSFGSITDSLEKLFHGAPDGEEYYDDNTSMGEMYDDTRPNGYA